MMQNKNFSFQISQCVVILAFTLIAGCSGGAKLSNDKTRVCADPYVLKHRKQHDKPIADPRAWTRIQSEESGLLRYDSPENEVPKLYEAREDIDGDGKPELFLSYRGSRNFGVTVFTRVEEGYRFLGYLEGFAFRVLEPDEKNRPRIITLVTMGGKQCSINTYICVGEKLTRESREFIHCGDGAPDENNRRIEEIFGCYSDRPHCLKWR